MTGGRTIRTIHFGEPSTGKAGDVEWYKKTLYTCDLEGPINDAAKFFADLAEEHPDGEISVVDDCEGTSWFLVYPYTVTAEDEKRRRENRERSERKAELVSRWDKVTSTIKTLESEHIQVPDKLLEERMVLANEPLLKEHLDGQEQQRRAFNERVNLHLRRMFCEDQS